MYVGSPTATQVCPTPKPDLSDYHGRVKARPSVAAQLAANKMLQKHPQFDRQAPPGGASPRLRKKRQDKAEASFASDQMPGGCYQPIKMTRHNFVVEDHRKDTGNRLEITTVSFGTGGNPSLAGTRDRGSHERLKKRWGQEPQGTHPGTAVEAFDEKRSSGGRSGHGRSSQGDSPHSGGKQSAGGLHKASRSAQFSLKQSKDSARAHPGDEAAQVKQIRHEAGSFSFSPRQQRASDTLHGGVEKRGGLPTMGQHRDSFEAELQYNWAPQTAAPDMRGHPDAIRVAQMNGDLEFDKEGNVVARREEGDEKRQPREMPSEDGRSSTVHSLFEASEEIAVNFLDQQVPPGRAGRGPRHGLGSERRVKLGADPQFLITSNSLFSKTSGCLDDAEKSIQDAKLQQSIDEVAFQLRPAQNFAQTSLAPVLVQRKPPVPACLPLQLRRTASALATKFARRFKSNSPVRIQTLPAPARALAPKYKAINAVQAQMLMENSLYGSIYSQRAQQQQQQSQRSGSNSSDEQSKSPRAAMPASQPGTFESARPSYAEPTRKGLLPRKALHRQKIAKALETLRHEQIKQHLVQNQNVTSVCERVLQSTVCQSDRAFEKFRRTNLNQLCALDKSSTTYKGMHSARFGPHIVSASDYGGGLSHYVGRSEGTGHSVQPHATLTVNLKFGANASPADYLPRLDYWRATKEHACQDHPLDEDSLMEEMIDVHNTMREYRDPVMVQSEEGHEPLGVLQTNGSFAGRPNLDGGSQAGDAGEGLTPWRSRLTRARNTLEATTTGPPLLDGIQGTSIAIHPVTTAGEKGPQGHVQKRATTKSDVTEAKGGPQMTFGVDNYQGQTHQTLQQIKSTTIDGQQALGSALDSASTSGGRARELQQPAKFGLGKHIRITKKNLAPTPSLEPSSNEGGEPYCSALALDQRTKAPLTGPNDGSLNSQGPSSKEESDRESAAGHLHRQRLRQHTEGRGRGPAGLGPRNHMAPSQYSEHGAERLLEEERRLVHAMERAGDLGGDLMEHAGDQEPPMPQAGIHGGALPGILCSKKRSLGQPGRVVIPRQVVPLRTFVHDGDAASPVSPGISSTSPSKPTTMRGLQLRASNCTSRVEQHAMAASPSFELSSNHVAGPPSELNTWPYAVDTAAPGLQPLVSPREKRERGRKSPIPPQDPLSYLHTQPIHLPSDNYYKGAKPLKNTIYNQQAKRHEEKVLTQKDQLDQAKLRQRSQIGGPPIAVEGQLPDRTPWGTNDQSGATTPGLQVDTTSTHTIERPPLALPNNSALAHTYMQHQQALETGMLSAGFPDALGLSVRTNSGGTAGGRPEQPGKDLEHLQTSPATPRRAQGLDRRGQLPQLVPGSHPVISADITTQSRVRVGSTIHGGSPQKRLQRGLQGSLLEELVVSGMGQFDKNNTHCHPLQTERRTERFVKQFKGKAPFAKNRPHFANRKKLQDKLETESLVLSQSPPSVLHQTHAAGFKTGPPTPGGPATLAGSRNGARPGLEPGSSGAGAASLGPPGSRQTQQKPPLEMVGQEKPLATPQRTLVLKTSRALTPGGSASPAVGAASPGTQLDSQSLHVSQVSKPLIGAPTGQEQVASPRRPVPIPPEQPSPAASAAAARRGGPVDPDRSPAGSQTRLQPRRDLSSHQAPRDQNLQRELNESFGHLGVQQEKQMAERLSKPSASAVTETDFERSAADANQGMPPVHDTKTLPSNAGGHD